MIRLKRKKWILLAMGLTLSVSLLLAHAYSSAPAGKSEDFAYKADKQKKAAVAMAEKDNLEKTSLNSQEALEPPEGTYAEEKAEKPTFVSSENTSEISRGAEREYPNRSNPPQNLKKSKVAPTSAPVQVAAPAAPKATESNTSSDLDLLARLIMAEAQGESYDAKVAVGAVVMNRVKSGAFSGSINGVIYQRINGYYQFTPVVNGWINKPANSDCIKAAREALSGVDPTNGALFYYDNKTTNSWMLSKPISTTIGNMIFAY